MKKFKFRLERVLNYRQLVRDEKKRDLMLKNLALQEAEQRLHDLEIAERSNGLAENQILSVEQVVLRGLYGARLQEEIINQRLAIVQAQKDVEEAMAAYVEAAQEAKSLELLRERKLQEYLDYLQKEDGKFLDELAVQRGRR